MSDVAGKWECVTKTPMGEQKMVMTVIPGEGDSFTGTGTELAGSIDLLDGKIDGRRLTWRMKMKVPLPMTLEGDATADGDSISGSIKAGIFGTSPMTGRRLN